jgi:hypothetical protein
MASEPDKGFKVTDRRVTAEEEPKPAEAKAGEPVKGPGWEMKEQQHEVPLPPMDFTTFCLSLASSAMIHLGQAPSPESGKTEKSLVLAKQTIDILALLEEKTRGNLSAEESKLISTVLYDLRLRFVQEKGAPKK